MSVLDVSQSVCHSVLCILAEQLPELLNMVKGNGVDLRW